MGFPRQEHWGGLPFPSPGHLHDPGIKSNSPTLAGRFFTAETPGLPWTRYCCGSVTKLCLTLRDPMNCSSPDFPVPHHLMEFAQVPVHWISDAIQTSHPLSPSSSAFTLSPQQGLSYCIQEWLPFLPPVDHISSELSTVAHPTGVALRGIARSFIELYELLYHNKAVIHEEEKV